MLILTDLISMLLSLDLNHLKIFLSTNGIMDLLQMFLLMMVLIAMSRSISLKVLMFRLLPQRIRYCVLKIPPLVLLLLVIIFII